MKTSKVSAAILLATFLVMTIAIPLPTVKATNGPREANLVEYFYGNVAAAYRALAARRIDIIASPITSTEYARAIATINDVLAPVADTGFYEFDLNNNYTTKDAKTYTSAMSYREMRQAVAFLTDKDYIVNVVCGGFAERIDQMIAAPLKGWANESYWYPNYPYEYNPLGAKAVLDSKFPEGATPNPYYAPLWPGSVQHIRTYPAGHEKAGLNLDPLIFCVRNDDTRRLLAGTLIIQNMRKLGVPITAITGDKSQLYDRVMGDMNYHLYTGSWDVGRFPILSLYGLYHSNAYFPYGSNYVTGIKKDVPKYPQLDALLAAGNYALDYNTAVKATKNAAGYMTIECINVPLWSDRAYYAYSNNLLGVVNMAGTGPINPYTFMNAYKSTGTAIKVGLISAPNTVNIVYSSWEYDYACLDRMNLYGGSDVPPYNLAAEQPGFVRDWTIGTWDDGGTTKTKVSMTFRSDDYFCAPVTGTQGANVNANYYFFNAWYDYQVGDGWFSGKFKDLHHVVMTGTYSFDIYYDTASYFSFYYCQGPLRPMDIWSAHNELVTKHTESFVEGTTVTTPGDVGLTKGPVWVEYVKDNNVALTPYIDYNIVKGKLHVYKDIADGHTVDVKYWAVGDPKGYTPGNLPWATVFEGAGMYYCTAFTEGVGGSVTFKRNPFYYWNTPPLGEIDFVRKTNGKYKVDIYDLVLAGGSQGSQGRTVPDWNWFPGADLAPLGGIIDSTDADTVTGQWDVEWDPPV